MPSELQDIEVEKISLVDRPANEREFLLFKSADRDPDELQEELDVQQDESLAKTLTRFLSDEERDQLIKELQEQKMSDADVDQQDDVEDVDKDVQDDDTQPEQDVDEPVEKADGADEDVDTGTDTSQDVDTSDLAKVDDVEELRKQLAQERDRRRRKEYIEKASRSYPSMPGTDEDKGELLKALNDQLDEDTYEAVTNIFDRVEKVLSEADLFKSFGSEDTEEPEIDLKKEARAMASEQDISYSEAMKQIRRENPELIQ